MSSTQELEAEADRIAARRADLRTPAVVRRAFLRPCALTLRKFLALEDVESPALNGRWPYGQAEQMAQAFCTSFAILFPGRDIPGPDLLDQAIAEMHDAIRQGFSTVMPMQFPRPPGSPATCAPADGLGWVARLVARTAHPADAVLDMPLDQLFIIVAAMSANEGAECTGEEYRDREIEGGKDSAVAGVHESEDGKDAQRGADDAERPQDNE
ncbi:MAG: hypothetical protein ACOYM3_04685 [Terrimicrobiaceae bacterium]